MQAIKSFHSNGKLLLTGEYAVLDGALSLAVPTRYGQSLSVTGINSPQLIWESCDPDGSVWFRSVLDLQQLVEGAIPIFKGPIEETLYKILREAWKMNPDFLTVAMDTGRDFKGYEVTTQLEFPRDWGLGSSSTLINNIAQWAEVDAYALVWNAFSGSGYDIACARHDRPILYRLQEKTPDQEKQNREDAHREGKHREKTFHPKPGDSMPRSIPQVQETDFDPPFQDRLYFVHLNKKQNSRDAISKYRRSDFDKSGLVKGISEITRKIISCKSLAIFESLMIEHEVLISQTLRMPTVTESLFPDFEGAIKSLGAWGGDFVLATGDETLPVYFKRKGHGTVIPYSEMVLGAGK